MELYKCVKTRRTIRRYSQQPVDDDVIRRVVDAGRLAASGGNRQPWRFLAVRDPELLTKVFDTVAWLAATGDPPEGQRPTAYIVTLGDTEIKKTHQSDCAAAMGNMSLAAHAEGLGTCWIGSIKRNELRALLAIPETLEIYGILAMGYPAEESVAEDSADTVSVYRAPDGTVHVPKRPLDDILEIR